MARKNKSKVRTTPAPVDKTKLAIAFVAAVDLIRRQWESLYYLFVADPALTRQILHIVPTLADSASLAFTVMIYLEIAKLHDPAESMNRPDKRNLVLRRVIDEIAPPPGTSERGIIESEYTNIQPVASKIKQWRNSAGAHKDLPIAIAIMDHLLTASQPHPLPHIPVSELEATVNSLFTIADHIVWFCQPGLSWRDTELIKPDVMKIAECLMRSPRLKE